MVPLGIAACGFFCFLGAGTVASELVLYISNDNVVEIDELIDSTTETTITSATVTFALKDSAGTTVTSGTGSLSHVAAGKFRGEIASSVTLTNKARYTLEITASTSDRDGFWRVPVVALYRTLT